MYVRIFIQSVADTAALSPLKRFKAVEFTLFVSFANGDDAAAAAFASAAASVIGFAVAIAIAVFFCYCCCYLYLSVGKLYTKACTTF